MSNKRVVITGIGGLCGLGSNARSIWNSMRSGVNGVTPLVDGSLSGLKVSLAGQIEEIPDTGLQGSDTITMDRFSVLAVSAAHEAFSQSGVQNLKTLRVDRSRYGAVIGTAICGAEAVEEGYRMLFLQGRKRTPAFAVPRIMPGAPAGQVSMALGLRGPVFGVTSACSSSNHAFICAMDQIRSDRADVMLTGGTEAPLTYGSLRAWESLRVLSKGLCRPFCASRDGLVLGEGAAIMVLESLEHAQRRGANILCEVAGGGINADSGNIVLPSLEGPVNAIHLCLENAKLRLEDVDYINAHGTATKANDRTETRAIRAVFGKLADNIPVSSTKSMHGHCLGASGALEMIACVNAINDGIIPPTINYENIDPECDLDYTPNIAREGKINTVLSNSFAFGGTNAVVAVRRFIA